MWSSGVRVAEEKQILKLGIGVGACASPIAQLVERAAVNLKVAGSNPAGRDALHHASASRTSYSSLALGRAKIRTSKYECSDGL